MTRPLVPVDASDPARVLVTLRSALSADGPAILPGAAVSVDVDSTHSRPSPVLPTVVPQRVAIVIETSGSSGSPKRVALSSNAVLASAAASATSLGGPGQWLLALPAHYIAGVNVLVRSIAAETDPVILPPGHFDPDAFIDAARRMDAALRFTSLVPAQLARLASAAENDSRLRETLQRFDRILVGGQSIPLGLSKRLETLGLRVTRTYGSSETSGGCVYDGVPIGTAQARIRDGQVELSGPMLAEGYLDDADRTAAAFVNDGIRWYRTGDTGTVDGVLTVTGRLDRVIISGGIKVSLDEVERVVRGMPGQSGAVAVPAPSAEWGEVPVIVTTAPVDLAVMRTTVGAALGRPAAPSRVELVDSIPLLPSGKPDRVALREWLSADH